MSQMSEKKFAELVQERLIDTDQVRQLVGLKSSQGVTHRVETGWYSGPILVSDKAFSLWDRVQVEREERNRLKAVEEADAMFAKLDRDHPRTTTAP